jgi:hypothetical protein
MKSFYKNLFIVFLAGFLILQPIFFVYSQTEDPVDPVLKYQQDCGLSGWIANGDECLKQTFGIVGRGILSGVRTVFGLGSGMAQRATDLLEKVTDLSIEGIFGAIFSHLGMVLGVIVSFEIAIVSVLLSPDIFQYATAPAVQVGFYTSLQIANGLLAIGLVILANRFILGQESYNDLRNLMKYIIIALVINFSLLFCSYAVGISNFLTISFLNYATLPEIGDAGIGIVQGTSSIRMLAIMKQFSQTFEGLAENYGDSEAGQVIANISILLILVVLSILLIMILAAMIVSLLARVIYLWILMMLVPLAIVGDTVLGGLKIPGIGEKAGGLFKTWSGSFIKWISFGPIIAGVIWFTFLIMGNLDNAFAAQTASGDVGLVMGVLGKFWSVLIALILLYKGYEFAHSFSAGVPGFVDKAVDKAKGWAVEKAAKYPGQVISKGATRFGGMFADSGFGRGVQKTFANVPGASWISRELGGLSSKRDELVKEDSKKTVAMYERMLERARTPAEREAILEKAKNILETDGMVALRPDQFGAMFNILARHDKGGLAEVIGRTAEGTRDAEKAIGNMIAMGRSYGAEIKAEDVYKINPALLRDPKKIAEFVRDEMSSEDISKLKAETLKGVLNTAASQGVTLSAGRMKDLMRRVADSSEKSAAVIDHAYEAAIASEALSGYLGKDGEALWVLEQQARGLTDKDFKGKTQEEVKVLEERTKKAQKLYEHVKAAAAEKKAKKSPESPKPNRDVGGVPFTRDDRGEERSPGGLYIDKK